MPDPKQSLAAYLSFTRKERIGIITLLLLILLLIFVPFLFPYFITSRKYDHSNFEKEIAALQLKQKDSAARFQGNEETDYTERYQPATKDPNSKKQTGELFYFDPNTLSADGWKRLGLRDKTIHTIQNYVSKGGKFRQAEDIARIWGLHEDEVSRLLPFVRIEQQSEVRFSPDNNRSFEKTPDRIPHARKIIDINAADTTDLISLPGIGGKLANRIVTFREKLGGFYSVEQVAETYALPDSVFQKIKGLLRVENTDVRKLNINTALLDELKMHPYIRYNLANAIVQYRNQHGSFNSTADLKNILIITPELFNKIEPYLLVR